MKISGYYGSLWRMTTGDATDKLFTGQRLDSTGLYYYGARYYDAEIGRFISADTIVSNPYDPQTLNRYSYCLNNPLKYTDPTGHDLEVEYGGVNDNGDDWYIIYEDGDLIGITTGWEGVQETYGNYCSARGLTDGCVVKYNYKDEGLGVTVPIYFVPNSSFIGSIMDNYNIGGIDIGSFAVFIRGWEDKSAAKIDEVIKHESMHYYDASRLGNVQFGILYGGELLLDWAFYGGSFYEGPYNVNSWEIRAREYAGQPRYRNDIILPWWIPLCLDLIFD